ncbi:MAG: S9 family peptidase [Caulobacter sp.]|nr:S9 family peptidase [Caulobacter sp.]
MLRLLACVATAALIGSVAVAAPIEAYGRLPAVQNVQISPDGGALAVILTNGDDRQIVVRSLTGQILAAASIGHRKVREVQWADNGHLIIISSSTAAIEDTTYVGEQFQAVSLTVGTGAVTQLPGRSTDDVLNTIHGRLTPGLDGAKAVIYTPLYVTIAGNMQRGSGHLDLFKIDLESGMARRQQMGDHDTYDYLAKADGSVVAKASFREREGKDDAVWTLSLRKGSGWLTPVTETVSVDTPSLFGLSSDGAAVIIGKWDEKTELWRPVPVSLADGKVGDYIGPERQQDVMVGTDGLILGYSHFDGLREYDFVEPRLKALWPAYRNAFKGQQVTLTSWTPDFRKLILFVEGGQTSGSYYLADTTTKRVDIISSAYPAIPPRDIGAVRAIRYPAADGLEIEAYLTLPPGKPEKGLPLIVLPHGGPRARDDASFDYTAQALVARGYAVLKPNFRGSSGYSHRFETAGYGEWGGKMQTDLSDGVAYLAAQGVIDPKRVCIMGSSYGGYAALAGVTLQKGVYRCSVAVSAVSDVGRLMRDDMLKYGERNAGVRDEKRLFAVDSLSDPKLDARSPDEHAADADAPILLIHGKDDTVVPFAHAQAMASALKKADKPFEFVVLDGEDHWMSNSATRLQKLTAAITFLEKYNPPN